MLLIDALLCRDCPGVFMRFVEDPQAESAKLTLKALNPQQQQQQQAGSTAAAAAADAQPVEISLSQPELQQLLKQLVLALSGSSSSSSSSWSQSAAAATSQPGNRQVSLQPAPKSSSSSSLSFGGTAAAAGAAAAAGGGRLLLLLDGVPAAELAPAHVTLLVTVMEDLVGQLPGQYSTAPPAVQVSGAMSSTGCFHC
jgi:hypothetical protein